MLFAYLMGQGECKVYLVRNCLRVSSSLQRQAKWYIPEQSGCSDYTQRIHAVLNGSLYWELKAIKLALMFGRSALG